MQESGQLQFINRNETGFSFSKEMNFNIFYADGHTEKQMIPMIDYKGKTICFMADLVPTLGHLPLPYVTGYDTRPLLSMNEKDVFLKTAVEKNFYLFLEHDAHNEIITVQNTEKGVRLNEIYTCSEILK
jgi:hypothetical protein